MFEGGGIAFLCDPDGLLLVARPRLHTGHAEFQPALLCSAAGEVFKAKKFGRQQKRCLR